MLGIRDDKIRERLLRCNDLTLQKAIDIVKAVEQTEQQVKNIKDENQVNSLKNRRKHDSLTDVKQSSFDKSGKGTKIDCSSCGRKHARKDCTAFGKTCRKCGGKNHFQAKCPSKTTVNRRRLVRLVSKLQRVYRNNLGTSKNHYNLSHVVRSLHQKGVNITIFACFVEFK